MNNHTCSPYCVSGIWSRYYSFVFRFVVSRREFKANHALDLIPFRRMKYNIYSTSLSVGRSIRVYTPLRILFCPLIFQVNELYDEISDHMPLNGSTQAILYVELTQLDCP